MFRAGSTVSEICEAFGLSRDRVRSWIKCRTGEASVAEFGRAVLARRIQMLNKLGYNTSEICKLLGCSPGRVQKLLSYQAAGAPVLFVKFDRTVKDKNGESLAAGSSGKLSWVDETTAKVIMVEGGVSYFLRWADLLGEVSYAGLGGKSDYE